MSSRLLPDELWNEIESLFPGYEASPDGGRPPTDARTVLTAVLFVLKTGLPWEYLPQELGWGSGMTAWRRLHAWQKQGVWKKVHEALLAHLQGAEQIDWSRAIIDSSSVRAVHGGKKRAPVPQIALNLAASITS